jgi:uncharacterized small protein (DUF1192 family)
MSGEESDDVRRGRGWILKELSREDLELLAVAELAERIEGLEAEIVRTRAQMDRKKAGRAAADALFAKPS